jgi:hypothetical protein
MADNQRVHPRTKDLEKNAGEYENQKPRSLLVPTSGLESEKGGVYTPSGGSMILQFPSDQGISTQKIPRYYSWPPKCRKYCCHCLGFTIWFLFELVVVIALACGILYLVFQPRIPEYSAHTVRFTNFSSNALLNTNLQFAVNVTAWNPNKKIGIYYLDHSLLALSYTGTELWTGIMPVFYQGHKNTTFFEVPFTRTGALLTNAMVSAFIAQVELGGGPLNLIADVPVKIKLGKLKLMKINVRMRQDLIVENFDVDKGDATAIVKTEKSKVSVKLWGLRFGIA